MCDSGISKDVSNWYTDRGAHSLLSRLLPSLSNGCVCPYTLLWFPKVKHCQSFYCPALCHFLFQSIIFTPESACSLKSECLHIAVFCLEFTTVKSKSSSLGDSREENLRTSTALFTFSHNAVGHEFRKALPNRCGIRWANEETRWDLL